jgi:hypothetical protein
MRTIPTTIPGEGTMDLMSISMTSQLEHRLRTARAEQAWRRMEATGRGVGPFGRLRALFARTGQVLAEQPLAPPAELACRSRHSVGAHG